MIKIATNHIYTCITKHRTGSIMTLVKVKEGLTGKWQHCLSIIWNGIELIHRSPTSTGSSVYSTPVGGITPATTPQTEGKGGLENCFVYKKEDADELFAGTAKKNRRNSKNDRRNSKAWTDTCAMDQR